MAVKTARVFAIRAPDGKPELIIGNGDGMCEVWSITDYQLVNLQYDAARVIRDRILPAFGPGAQRYTNG